MSSDLIGSHQILSSAEFDGVKAARAGVIVNVDKPTPPPKRATAHDPWCTYPSKADFQTKVIDNGGRHGAYYYFLRQDDAEAALGEVYRHDCE